jgi:hypothetical protein
MKDIILSKVAGELVVDSRIVAEQLDIEQLAVENSLLSGILQKPFLNTFDVLAIIRCLSLLRYFEANKNVLPNLFVLAERLAVDTPAFSLLKLAVTEGLSLDLLGDSSEKSSVQGWFEKNFKTYFPEAKLVEVYSIERKRPDCILDIAGVHYPVECKLNFSKRGLSQLKKYMKLWNVDRGIAVANDFFVKTPQSISAIKTV